MGREGASGGSTTPWGCKVAGVCACASTLARTSSTGNAPTGCIRRRMPRASIAGRSAAGKKLLSRTQHTRSPSHAVDLSLCGVAATPRRRPYVAAHQCNPPGRSLSRVRLGSDWRLRAESISEASRSWCRRVGSGCGRVALFGSSSLRSHTALGQPKTLRPSLKGVPCTPWGWVIDATKDRS